MNLMRNPESLLKENPPAEKSNGIERTSPDSRQGMSVFDNYNLNTERDSGSYFERMQRQNLEPEREPLEEQDTGVQSSDVQIEEEQNAEENDSSLKRERKKIDIANPDIIENFFRASED